MTPEQIAKFFELYELTKVIINSDRSWEDKYYMIFSDEISDAIALCGITVTWHDTNMTDEENIMAYWDLLTNEYIVLKSEEDQAQQK